MNHLPLLGVIVLLAIAVFLGSRTLTRAQEAREVGLEAYRNSVERAVREVPPRAGRPIDRVENRVERIVRSAVEDGFRDEASRRIFENSFGLGGEDRDFDEDRYEDAVGEDGAPRVFEEAFDLTHEEDDREIEETREIAEDIEDIEEQAHDDVPRADGSGTLFEEVFDLTEEEDERDLDRRKHVEDLERRKLKDLERREIDARRDAKRAELQARKRAMQNEREARAAAEHGERIKKEFPLLEKEREKAERLLLEAEDLRKRAAHEGDRLRVKEVEALLIDRRALADRIREEQARLDKEKRDLLRNAAEKSLGRDEDFGFEPLPRRPGEKDALSARERIAALRQAALSLRRAGRDDMAARLEREASGAERAARKARTFDDPSAPRVLEAVRDLHEEVRQLRGDIQALRESLAER